MGAGVVDGIARAVGIGVSVGIGAGVAVPSRNGDNTCGSSVPSGLVHARKRTRMSARATLSTLDLEIENRSVTAFRRGEPVLNVLVIYVASLGMRVGR